jgi:beta propeller repeat protein
MSALIRPHSHSPASSARRPRLASLLLLSLGHAVALAQSPPVAEAGPGQHWTVPRVIHLDGSGSYDPDNDPITPITQWQWQFDSLPPGSTATLSGASTPTPTFTADLPGSYVVSLTVFAGGEWSPPDTVTITGQAVIPLGGGGLRVTEYRLTTETYNQYAPTISGVNVVYTQVEGNGELFRVIINGEPGPIVQGPGNQFDPDLSGTSVAYTNDVTGLQDIWFYDFLTQEQYKVTASYMADYEPAISGNNIVYTSTNNYNEDIYWVNTLTGSEFPIASTSNAERFPAIDGELVAWVAFEGGNANIRARYLEQVEFPVATTVASEVNPSVSGGRIAYLLDTDVAVFDTGTGETLRVTEDGYQQSHVKIAGNYVFFTDNRNGNLDIFMHDLGTGLTYQLTSDVRDQILTDADQNRAVFYDSRYGSNDIFAVELTWNHPPIADAGQDQSVYAGDIAYLDGTGSSDPDNDPIVDFRWTFESRPAGSGASLDNDHSATPTFVPDLEGDYILSLVVFDGVLWSDPDFVILVATSNNLAPIAEAGTDQLVDVGKVAELDGTDSWDPDGDPIVGYSWAIDLAPGGSMAELIGADTDKPTLTPDIEGSYVISLVVYDGEDWSAPDWVTVVAETPNLPPVAFAGDDQQVIVGETVYLSGSGYDPEGKPIVGWHWSIKSGPLGYTAHLDDPNSRTPTFVPDVIGDYGLGLIVFDGEDWSEWDLMTVTVDSLNVPPIADAGEDRNVIVGRPVLLDGSGSWDPDNEPVVGWSWAVSAAPPGSVAQPAQWVPLSAIAAGTSHSLGVKPNGSVVCWGRNNANQCSVPAPNTGFAAASGGEWHSLGLKADGSILGWGSNDGGQCSVPEPNSGFTAIAAGANHSLALRADGSIAAWGWNYAGQCNVPDPNSGFTAIAARYGRSLAVKSDGSVVAWGDYSYNLPDPNSGFVAVAAGSVHSLGLKGNGSIVAWGENGAGQCNVPAPSSGFTAIAAGGYHSLGLKADGSIVAWGANGSGQCNVPAPNSGFTAIAAGGYYSGHSLGLKADGSIVAWGSNGWGQCATWTLVPTAVFTPDVVGTYVLSLVVYDHEDPSAPDFVTITALPNQPPVAEAGPDQDVEMDQVVQLDGTGSWDPDGDPLTAYLWSFEQKPPGSLAALDDPGSATPTFLADLAGDYVLSLVVYDGEDWSTPDTVTISAAPGNQPPVAVAGPDQETFTEQLVQLDGAASFDPDGDPILGYHWQIDVKPAGSTAELSDPDIVNPTFTGDLPGEYQISLVVFDGEVWSLPDQVLVTAEQPGDLNCDGAVNFDDINPFVTALVSQAGYEARYPDCRWLNADINLDGAVDFDDINPFVRCLVAGRCP